MWLATMQAMQQAPVCLSVLTHSMWHAPENQFGKFEIRFGWASVQFSTARRLWAPLQRAGTSRAEGLFLI